MTTETGSVMLRLREQTAEHHKRAEARPLEQALIQGTLPRDAFVALLGQRFLIHVALEADVRRLTAQHPVIGSIITADLFQEENLRRDLDFFGVDPAAVRPSDSTSRFLAQIEQTAATSPLALLGIYYVFEGSKNGARFVARRVRPAYGLAPGPGTLYLDPHGEQQRPLWDAFKGRMDAADLPPDAQAAMVTAAQATFDAIAAIDDAIFG